MHEKLKALFQRKKSLVLRLLKITNPKMNCWGFVSAPIFFLPSSRGGGGGSEYISVFGDGSNEVEKP